MRQVWENLTDDWQIFLSEPAVQDEEGAEEPALQDEEWAEEQAQPFQNEDPAQPEGDEEQAENSE